MACHKCGRDNDLIDDLMGESPSDFFCEDCFFGFKEEYAEFFRWVNANHFQKVVGVQNQIQRCDEVIEKALFFSFDETNGLYGELRTHYPNLFTEEMSPFNLIALHQQAKEALIYNENHKAFARLVEEANAATTREAAEKAAEKAYSHSLEIKGTITNPTFIMEIEEQANAIRKATHFNWLIKDAKKANTSGDAEKDLALLIEALTFIENEAPEILTSSHAVADGGVNRMSDIVPRLKRDIREACEKLGRRTPDCVKQKKA